MPIELLVCAVREASQPGEHEGAENENQLKPSMKRAICGARPDSNSPSSTRMKAEDAPTRWV